MFLRTVITKENVYELLPDYLELVMSRTDVSAPEVVDMCLAICAADENVGTNRLELDIDKFFGIPVDDIWSRILILCGVSEIKSNADCLPRVQKERIIVDVMIMCLRMKGFDFRGSYNSEVSKEVAYELGIKEVAGISDNRNEQDVADSLRRIQSLLYEQVQEETSDFDNEDEGRDILRKLSRYALVLSKIFNPNRVTIYYGVSNIRGISIRQIPFYIEDMSKLTEEEKEFVRTYLIVEESISARAEFLENIESYRDEWLQALVQLSFDIAERAYGKSPSIAVDKLRGIKKLYPIGVFNLEINMPDNDLIAEELMELYAADSMHRFTDEDINKVLAVISILVNKKPVDFEKIKDFVGR